MSGCTDSRAVNYQSPARVDDGSCLIPGCLDTDADGDVDADDRRRPQFSPHATYHDGSCPYIFFGCTSSSAANYRPLATEDDGGCAFPGCMHSAAPDFNPSATHAAPCAPSLRGCTSSAAANFASAASADDGSCLFAGCTDPRHPAYDASATLFDGSCVVHPGCTAPAAINFHPLYNYDDGSCLFARPASPPAPPSSPSPPRPIRRSVSFPLHRRKPRSRRRSASFAALLPRRFRRRQVEAANSPLLAYVPPHFVFATLEGCSHDEEDMKSGGVFH
ncbi:hypothetical protein AB1Y20_004923 [Prymnesium parvum]|uniref:Cellulase n=1 Tax=Prymnesium parvum TaxID=97485 RepID=A0AB34IZS2_PRYPA